MRGRCFDFDHAAAARAARVPARPAEQGAVAGLADNGPLRPPGRALLALQRTYGNHYVQQAVLQAKLVTGPPGDRYEREADRVAQAVVRGIAGRRMPDIQAVGGVPAGTEPGDALESQIKSATGGARGHRIPGQVRAPLEQALAADLSGVRVHHDTEADQLNRSWRASALTMGSDIFFRRGAYAPGSLAGDALLTHELVHVVQQRGAPGPAEVVQLNRPEDYANYAEAKNANMYSRALLDRQRGDTLEAHVGKAFTSAERDRIYAVNKGGTTQITSDTDDSNLYLQDTDVTPHVDHRFPKSKGGSNSYTNAAVLPAKLNIQKSDQLDLTKEPDLALPPYRKLVDPVNGVMAVKDFSQDQKKAIYKANIAYYGQGSIVSDHDEVTELEKWDSSEVPHVDHISPKSAGGSSFYFNAKVISAEENVQKGGERGGTGGEADYDYFELNMTLTEYYKNKTSGELPSFLDVPTSPTSDEEPKKKRKRSSSGAKRKKPRTSERGRSSSTGSKTRTKAKTPPKARKKSAKKPATKKKNT